MSATLLIVFREVLEASLIIGIALAATRGVPSRNLWINLGIGGGLLGALVIAFFAEAIANSLEGLGQEVFNASVLLRKMGRLQAARARLGEIDLAALFSAGRAAPRHSSQRKHRRLGGD